ncbi:hypothetical protein ACFSTC_24820 [Nonomuraea ferruginea]
MQGAVDEHQLGEPPAGAERVQHPAAVEAAFLSPAGAAQAQRPGPYPGLQRGALAFEARGGGGAAGTRGGQQLVDPAQRGELSRAAPDRPPAARAARRSRWRASARSSRAVRGCVRRGAGGAARARPVRRPGR